MQHKVDIFCATDGKQPRTKVLTFSKGQMGASRRTMALETIAHQLSLACGDNDLSSARCYVKTPEDSFEMIKLGSLWSGMVALFEDDVEKCETPHYLLHDSTVLLSTTAPSTTEAPSGKKKMRKHAPSIVEVRSQRSATPTIESSVVIYVNDINRADAQKHARSLLSSAVRDVMHSGSSCCGRASRRGTPDEGERPDHTAHKAFSCSH